MCNIPADDDEEHALTAPSPGLPEALNSGSAALIDHLRTLRGRNISVLLNKGNRGDGIIMMGGRRLGQELGLQWREIWYPEPAQGDVLLVYGAGAFTANFNAMADHVTHYERNFQEIVILPASFEAQAPRIRRFLQGLDARKYTLYCRERISLNAVQALRPDLPVRFSHDLGFHADLSAWVGTPGKGTLATFREDVEKRVYRDVAADERFDASGGREDEPLELVKAIARFERIHSDRLHVAVVGALLGKEVILYEGAYHKIRGVFEASLSHFPTVHLVSSDEDSLAERIRRQTDFPRMWQRLKLRSRSRAREIANRFTWYRDWKAARR